MLSSSSRCLTVAVATAAVLVAGLVGPAAGEPAPELPATVTRVVDGLPAARPGAHVSERVATPIAFSMVGFEVPPGAELSFRTSADGENWGEWTATEVVAEEGPDPESAEGRAANFRMTMPIWVGEARHVQTRLEGAATAAAPEQAAVHLVDSSGLGRSWRTRMADKVRSAWHGTPAAAHAATSRPTIVTRSQWGADESLRRGSPSYATSIKAGFVHHTAGSNSYSQDQADDVVRGIYSYHVKSNGWSDIGYNFLVDRYGTIYEGRYGGMGKPVIGAHAGGFNTATFGASLMGSFDSVGPPRAMRRALRRLLAWKYDVHHTNVLGKTSYTTYGSTRYPSGGTVKIYRLSGHREASLTACPGDKVYAMLPNLRKQVAQLQGPVILYPRGTPSTIDIVDGASVSGPVKFRARLRPAGAWKVTVKSSDGVVVSTRTGNGDRVVHDWYPAGMTAGTYRYRITSPDRRAARGTVTLKPPVITASASPPTTTFAPDGTVAPVTFSGTVYDNASWVLRIFDPAGVRVHRATGTGSTFSTVWNGPVSKAGAYQWDVSAYGADPATGSVYVEADFVDRTALRKATAAAAAVISRRTFTAGGATHAVLSPITRPGFAMSAGPVAGTAGPVLYAGESHTPAATLTELDRVLPAGATVYVMGDTSIISDEALDDVAATRGGKWSISRIDGANAVKVAAAAASVVLGRTKATSVILAGNSGSASWQQGVAAGAYAAGSGLPILLTKSTTLSPPAAKVLERPDISSVTVVGNSDAVSADVVETVELTKIVKRVAGKNGAATAVAVSRELFGRGAAAEGDAYLFANTKRSDGWSRALAAVPLGALRRAPLLVARTGAVPWATTKYLDGLGYSESLLGSGTVLGNASHIDSSVEATLARRLQ